MLDLRAWGFGIVAQSNRLDRPQSGFLRAADRTRNCSMASLSRLPPARASADWRACNPAHALSIAFRLMTVGIDAHEARRYIPRQERCTRLHQLAPGQTCSRVFETQNGSPFQLLNLPQ